MSIIAASSQATAVPRASRAFKAVGLFCLLGLAVSAAVLPLIAPEVVVWVLAHIE
jgi:hypothetical protein